MSRFFSRPLSVCALAMAMAVFVLAGCSGTPDGQNLVSSKCSRCHTLDQVNNANKTQAQWEQTVAIMEGHGLQVTTAEKSAIVSYLVKSSSK
ncbi:MAG: hypothetical protein HGA39_02270 [Coriobacteriia bacterium]|nr:hypothetical protein [Coriobacteriia bacterium]